MELRHAREELAADGVTAAEEDAARARLARRREHLREIDATPDAPPC